MNIKIRVTKPTPAPIFESTWLQNIAVPIFKACRFRDPISIELRPMSGFSGYVSETDVAGHICLSSRAIFWDYEKITGIVLHEYVHALMNAYEKNTSIVMPHHGPVFFLVLMSLARRVDRRNNSENKGFFNSLSLYDFSNVPSRYPSGHEDEFDENLERALVFYWALSKFIPIADDQSLAAEDLPNAAHIAWLDHLKEEKEGQRHRGEKAETILNLENKNINLKQWLWVFASLTFVLFFLFIYSAIF